MNKGKKDSKQISFFAVLCFSLWITQSVMAIESIQWTGDFRARFQAEKDSAEQRNRLRERFRIKVKSVVSDDITLHTRFASGSTDARSTNQTLGDGFSTKGLQLDQSYIEIRKYDFNTKIGKMKNPLFRSSDLMWDSDINPEGIAISYKKNNMTVSTGYFVLDESSSVSNDPYLVAVQPKLKTTLNNDISIYTSLNYYYMNVKDRTFDSTTSNTLSSGVLANNYQVIGLSGKIKKENLYSGLDSALIFDVFSNSEVSSDNNAYLIGAVLGDLKVSKKGQWKIKSLYRYLESDATLDILPDSDAYSGQTGIKGYEFILQFSVLENIINTIDYYRIETLSDGQVQHLVQFDLGIKF